MTQQHYLDTVREEDIKKLLAPGTGVLRTVVPMSYNDACLFLYRGAVTTQVLHKDITNVIVREPFKAIDFGDDNIPDEIVYRNGGGMFVHGRRLHEVDSLVGASERWRDAKEMEDEWSRLTVTVEGGAALLKPFEHSDGPRRLNALFGGDLTLNTQKLRDEWIRRCGSHRDWGLFCTLIRDNERSASYPPLNPPEVFDHELKTWPEYFRAIWNHEKTFEVRSTRDRRFEIGQRVMLREWDPDKREYTGRSLKTRVTYVMQGGNPLTMMNMPSDLAVFSFTIDDKNT